MAHPPRNSSLNDPPMYHFRGSQQPPLIQISDVSEDDDSNEKNGFRTPDSESEKPLSYSYPIPSNRNHLIPQQPLINHIKNEWHKGGTIGTGETDDDFCPEGWMEVFCSRAFKRWLLVYFVLTIVFWIWWFRYFAPRQAKSTASLFLADSLRGRFEDTSEWGYFGTNKRAEFAGMRHLNVLDRSLVPGSEVEGVVGRRLIIVGDVHGCAEELKALLEKVSFDASKDHLVNTGDMVSKGSSSGDVIDIMMSHNASCVRGNNEDKILHAYRDHHAPSYQKVLTAQDSKTEPLTTSLKRGHRKDLLLASSLTPEQINYIAGCPVILNLGAIPNLGSNVSVVHAGLLPGVALEKQDPTAVMTMRSIDLRNQVPSPRHPPDPSSGPPPRPRSRLRKPDYSQWDEQGRLAVLPWGDVWEAFQDLVPDLLAEGEAREKNPPTPADEPAKPKIPAPPRILYNPTSQQNPDPARPLNPYKNLSPSSVIYGHDYRPGIVQGRWHFGLDGGCVHGGVLAAMVLEEKGFMAGLAGGKVRHSIVTVKCKDHMKDKTKHT